MVNQLTNPYNGDGEKKDNNRQADQRKREKKKKKHMPPHPNSSNNSVCLCIPVCVREGETGDA